MLTKDQCASLINQSLLELQNGNLQHAWHMLQQARDEGSHHVELHIGFGAVYERMGELSKAYAAFDYAVSLDPHSAQAYNNRGRLYLLWGRLDEAMADFQQTLALQPENARAHYNIGGVLAEQGRWAEALAAFQTAAALHYPTALQTGQDLQSQLAKGTDPRLRGRPSAEAGRAPLNRAVLTLTTFAYATMGPDCRLTMVDAKWLFGLVSRQKLKQQVRWAVTVEALHEFSKYGYNGNPRGAILEIAQQPPFMLRVTEARANWYELAIFREQPIPGVKRQTFQRVEKHTYTVKETELAQALHSLLTNRVLRLTEDMLTYLG